MSNQFFDDYHRWYYDTAVWEKVRFLGVPVYKSVSDLWNYQEILVQVRPSLVSEFGTWCGGSAIYFDSIMTQIGGPYRVLSVDIDQRRKLAFVAGRATTNIEFMQCSSTDPSVARRIRELRDAFPGPMFVILDSNHSKAHVLAELLSLRPITVAGDYVIVEDSNISGHPVLPSFGEGPYEAIAAYEHQFPDDYRHDREREAKFGFSFAPNGFLVRR